MAYKKNAFSGLGTEMLEIIRSDFEERLDDAAFEERIIGIENATATMMDAKVKDEKIIEMLQKYWDLRLSEASRFLENEKKKKINSDL